MRKNQPLADELAGRVQPHAKACYRNSVLALFAYRGNAEACYVEGLVAIAGGTLLIEHGWLMIDGEIVDVTMDDCPPCAYHPIVGYSRDQVQRRVSTHQRLPFFASSKAGRGALLEAQLRLYRQMEVQTDDG